MIPLTALRVTALRPCAVPLALASAAPLPFPPPPPAFIPGLWQQAPADWAAALLPCADDRPGRGRRWTSCCPALKAGGAGRVALGRAIGCRTGFALAAACAAAAQRHRHPGGPGERLPLLLYGRVDGRRPADRSYCTSSTGA